jgi:hypothetical protein
MIYVGVDPGRNGALACLHGLMVEVEQMPFSAGSPDVMAIATLFGSTWRRKDVDEQMFVAVELQAYLPGKFGGGKANWWRGGWHYLFETLLTCGEIPHVFVRPQAWQKEMLGGTPKGTTKQRSLIAARRLFPMSKIASDGEADALLIAEWARRSAMR